ncbi:MAG: hypothetical protein ABSE73_19200, partial [Planctomycetota bacterium]
QESLTLIAYDEAGMSEAVGSLYEAAAGLEPLTPLAPPTTNALVSLAQTTPVPEALIAWQAALPDRAVALAAAGEQVTVTTYDGSVSTLDASGKVVSQKAADAAVLAKLEAPKIPEALKGKLLTGRIAKHLAAGDKGTAVAYWGGTVQVFDTAGTLKTQQWLAQDITGLAWAGNKLAVGLADGRVVGLEAK